MLRQLNLTLSNSTLLKEFEKYLWAGHKKDLYPLRMIDGSLDIDKYIMRALEKDTKKVLEVKEV